jgi:anti-sigma B factor antagonist
MRALSFSAFAPFTRPSVHVVPMTRDPGHPHRWKFRAEVQSKLDSGIRHVVIDCAETGYLDGRDRGVLITLSKRARESGGSLQLRGLNAETREMFACTLLDTVLTIEEEQQEAK